MEGLISTISRLDSSNRVDQLHFTKLKMVALFKGIDDVVQAYCLPIALTREQAHIVYPFDTPQAMESVLMPHVNPNPHRVYGLLSAQKHGGLLILTCHLRLGQILLCLQRTLQHVSSLILNDNTNI